MVGFGDAVQKDLKGFGITVTAVLPGPIHTPLRRRSVPDEDSNLLIGSDEVAEVIVFLAGDSGALVTGNVLHLR